MDVQWSLIREPKHETKHSIGPHWTQKILGGRTPSIQVTQKTLSKSGYGPTSLLWYPCKGQGWNTQL